MTAGDIRRHILIGLSAALATLATGLVALWRVLRPALVFLGQLVLALVVIFEEWGWQPLARALAALGRYRPWAILEGWIASLPPYGALAVFAMPAVLLFPLKLVALWLLTGGHVIFAGLVFVGAKLAGTAFLARIFMLTQPALMRIGWFARVYERFMPWKHAAEEWLRTSWAWRYGRVVKARMKKAAKTAWERLRPSILALRETWRPMLARALERAKAAYLGLLATIRKRYRSR